MNKLRYEQIKAHDGTDIRMARFEPDAVPAGVIQMVHGFGEGILHYVELAKFFTQNGYVCVIHDQRGFGEMPDKTRKERRAARGITPGYSYFLEDIKTLRAKIGQWYPGTVVILFGFSMGGNIAVNHLLTYPEEPYDKLILESPWLRLYKPLSRPMAGLARLMGKISPKLRTYAKLDRENISRNREMVDSLQNDGVFHERLSLRLYTEIVDAGERAMEDAPRLNIPTLLLCGGEDRIVCPKAIRAFSGNAKENVRLLDYPDGRHCLHLDIIHAEVLGEMLAFIQS